MSLNKVMLIGRLGADPEQRTTQTGTNIVNFTLATSERFKDSSGEWQEKTEWHKCVCFGDRALTMGKYLKKGSRIYLEGSNATSSWENKEGQKMYKTEVKVREFVFLDSADGSSGQGNQQQSQNNYQPPESTSTIYDDDIPF